MIDYDKDSRQICVKKSGVIDLNYGDRINVNTVDMLSAISRLVDIAKPQKDCYGKFSGVVSITIEFTGDMKEDEEMGDESDES
ncbi:MAG: hypothetical protein IJ386_01675 [Clostridia bacterium]|nr:hypothetical protein [Clostridia bacterium]